MFTDKTPFRCSDPTPEHPTTFQFSKLAAPQMIAVALSAIETRRRDSGKFQLKTIFMRHKTKNTSEVGKQFNLIKVHLLISARVLQFLLSAPLLLLC